MTVFASWLGGRWAGLIALAAVPDEAIAHTIIPGISGFEGGLLHPVLVPTHAINVIAMALLVGLRNPEERRALIAIFAAGLGGAIALVALAFATDQAEMILLWTGLMCGFLVAARVALPLAVAALLAIIVAFALQLDSVPATISIGETLLTLTGSALASVFMLALITLLATRMTRPWQAAAVRIAGSWIAAIALLILALKFR